MGRKTMRVVITNERTGETVCDRAWTASNFLTRLVGLLGRKTFEPGEGLLIRPTSAVHTLGMAFAIDVVALNKNLQIADMRADVRPGRIAVFPTNTYAVLELPCRQIWRSAMHVGDRLMVAPVEAGAGLSLGLVPNTRRDSNEMAPAQILMKIFRR